MQTVEVTISKDGRTVGVEAIGFKGESCKTATQEVLERLGMTKDGGDKPELYETESCDIGG